MGIEFILRSATFVGFMNSLDFSCNEVKTGQFSWPIAMDFAHKKSRTGLSGAA